MRGMWAEVWEVITTPPHLRPLYLCIYVATVLIGVATFVSPPASVEGAIGPVLSTIWALSFIVGGALGAFTVLTPVWALERVALVFCLVGVTVYAFVVVWLHVLSPPGSSRLTQIGIIVIATGAYLARVLVIGGYTYDPRSGRAGPTT